MTIPKKPPEWLNAWTEAEKLLQLTNRMISERISGINSGMPAQAFAKQHLQARSNIVQLTADCESLETAMYKMKRKKRIEQAQEQAMLQKLLDLRQRIDSASIRITSASTLGATEQFFIFLIFDILFLPRTSLFRPSSLYTSGPENDETKMLTNEELLELMDTQADSFRFTTTYFRSKPHILSPHLRTGSNHR